MKITDKGLGIFSLFCIVIQIVGLIVNLTNAIRPKIEIQHSVKPLYRQISNHKLTNINI